MLNSREGKGTLRLVVVSLYLLLLLSLVQTGLVIQLYATGRVDSTLSAGLILVFISSQLSIIFISIHSLLARRHRLTLMYSSPRTRLSSLCRFLPRILIMIWLLAAGAGLIVAARQPRCRPGHAMQNFWQTGQSCQLHRAVVGMAVMSFISTCTVFCCIEVSNRPYNASLFGIVESDQEGGAGLRPSTSAMSWSSTSTSDSLRREKLYHYRPEDLESLSSDQSFWVQRRDSRSSQSAIFPRNLRYSSTGPLSSPGSLRLNRTPSNFSPQIPYVSSYRSISSSSANSPSTSAGGNCYGSLPPTRTVSVMSSFSRSTSLTSTRRSPLSTMRRASEPEVPIIPAKFLDPDNKIQLQRSPTLPCSWSPSLNHAPLSADPAIRALSTEGEAIAERPVTNHALHAPSNGIRFFEPLIDPNLSLQNSSIPPDLPVRARGHSIPSNTGPADIPPVYAPPRIATYTTCPPISAASKSTVTLRIPRTRPSHATLKNSVIDNNSHKCPLLTADLSSTPRERTISSRLSRDFATHNVSEAQRVKRRWELARSREAHAYGMGSWSTLPPEIKQPAVSLRKARAKGREKKRACIAS